MNRRWFLGRLSLLPFLAKGWISTKPLAVPANVIAYPKNPLAEQICISTMTVDGVEHMYVRAQSRLELGDIVWHNGHMIGVAVSPISAGNFGIIRTQGYGPITAKS
jgi:hypothetical protein